MEKMKQIQQNMITQGCIDDTYRGGDKIKISNLYHGVSRGTTYGDKNQEFNG
jgi:hypothetical protein